MYFAKFPQLNILIERYIRKQREKCNHGYDNRSYIKVLCDSKEIYGQCKAEWHTNS